jgi:hypothetical protein
MGKLAERQCVPCRGDVPPLTREQLSGLIAQIDEAWDVRDVPGGLTESDAVFAAKCDLLYRAASKTPAA